MDHIDHISLITCTVTTVPNLLGFFLQTTTNSNDFMIVLISSFFLALVDEEMAIEWKAARDKANPTLAPKWNKWH